MIICLILWAPAYQSTVSPEPTSPASFPVNPLPSQPFQWQKISVLFPTHFMLSLLGPFIPPHISAGVLPVLYHPFQTLPLHVAHLVPIGNCVQPALAPTMKEKQRGWLNNPSLAKGLRGQVCLELKPNLCVSAVTLLLPTPSKLSEKFTLGQITWYG